MDKDINLNNKTNLNPDILAIKENVVGTDDEPREHYETRPLPKSGQNDAYVPKAHEIATWKKVNDVMNSKVKTYTPEQKQDYIQKFNGNKSAQVNKIGVFDEEKEKVVGKVKYNWIKTAAIIGIIALIVIAGAAAVFAYLAYKDGTLLTSPSSLICGNTNVTVVQASCPDINIPSCPELPDINVTCAPQIRVVTGNQT